MIFFARRFKQDVRELSKKYRHIRSDLQTTLEEIAQGNLIGNQISGVGYPVFKVRIKNSDINKGKSGGYRLIYYIQSSEVIIMITIYSKSDQADISTKEIREIIADYKT
ncbi:MAG: type II toxin-antitoxin system RelE/ParE family toxin [Snowella sp.]|nr:type II toxin-antitoxin system RelE/ParE family toxin [Snowella sp.]